MRIETELDFIYIYKGKKFLTKEEAIKYKELLKHMKMKRNLSKNGTKKKTPS